MTKVATPRLCTQSQLAEMAGLHRVTVVKALRGDESVAESTRERVRKLARDAAYLPNAAAQAIRDGKHHAIGLLSTPKPGAGFSSGIMHQVSTVLAERDIKLVLGRLDDQELVGDKDLPRILREWSVDGLLIGYCKDFPLQLIDHIRRLRLPALWLNAKLDTHCVHPDDYQGARQATQMLIDAGHQRILYEGLGIPEQQPNEHYSRVDRFLGYRDAMRAAGLGEVAIKSDPMDSAELRSELRLLLRSPDRPSAIVSTAQSGATALFAAMESGLSVPRDLSLVAIRDPTLISCFDYSGRVLGVDVSAMDIPVCQVGQIGTERILQHVGASRRSGVAPVAVPFTPHEGKTVAHPPAVIRE